MVTFIHRRIFAKFSLVALGLWLVVTVVVLGLFLQDRAERHDSLVSTEIVTIANKLARPAARLLEAEEVRAAGDLLGVFASFPYAICAEFILSDNAPKAAWPPIGCTKMPDGRDIDLPQPIVGADARFLVRIDPVILAEDRRLEQLVVSGLVSLGGLLLFVSAAVGFALFVLRPLRRLSGAIADFEETGDHRHVSVGAPDEMGRVMAAYNNMVDEEVGRREEIRSAHSAILDSVTYAKRIQTGLLPDLGSDFKGVDAIGISWHPRDTVSGDIYWTHVSPNRSLIAVLDCTGHGVPGAFMTMLAIATLERIMTEDPDLTPAQILTRLSDLTRALLYKQGGSRAQSDGMDGAMVSIAHATGQVTFAGARESLYVRQDGQVQRIKGDRASIGYAPARSGQTLTDIAVDTKPGDLFAIVTDGASDQLGGPKRLAYGHRRFASLMAQHTDPQTLCDSAWAEVEAWRGDNERLDDVTVVSFVPSVARG